MSSVYFLLGANLGDRVVTLQRATNLISERIGAILRQSALYETAPWGVTDQPTFLNQVLVVRTDLLPEEVLTQTQAIEQELGRVRHEKWGARLIDIDILYYDELVINTDTLSIPHPYLHERRFTLVPLVEIAPYLLHPTLHKTTSHLLIELNDNSQVSQYNPESSV